MMANAERYVTESNIEGDCDLCRFEGSVKQVVGGYHLCPGCIETVATRADSRVMDADSEYDDREEAFEAVLDDHAGASIILHYPTGDSPEETHTYTVENVEHYEIRFGDENTVVVNYVGGDSDTFTGTGLTVSGMSL